MTKKAIKQRDIDKLIQRLEREKEDRIEEYLSSLPKWLPKRYRDDCGGILVKIAFWLSIDVINDCAENPFKYGQASETLHNMANIPHSEYSDMMIFLLELKHASALGEEEGTIFLDRENRQQIILSKVGSKGAKKKEVLRRELKDHAIFLCNQLLTKNKTLKLDYVALKIAPDMIDYSNRLSSNIIRSETRLPRTLKDWLKEADQQGKLER